MTLFDYKIDISKLHGFGLFTNEDIKKGTVLFKSNPKLDIELTKEDFDCLNESEKKEFIHYGYLDKKSKTYKLDFDTALRFLNFSEDGNIYQDVKYTTTYLVAARDIKAGEEIVFNYLEVMDQSWFDQGLNN